MVLHRHHPVSSPDHPKNIATLFQSDLKLHCIHRTDRCMHCTRTGSSGECNLRKPGGHTSLTNSFDDQRMITAYTIGSSGECSLCLLGGHTSLTNTSDDAGSTDTILRRIIRHLQVLTPILGHPPLDIHRIDRWVHSLHVRSSGEHRLRSFLPKCHLSY